MPTLWGTPALTRREWGARPGGPGRGPGAAAFVGGVEGPAGRGCFSAPNLPPSSVHSFHGGEGAHPHRYRKTECSWAQGRQGVRAQSGGRVLPPTHSLCRLGGLLKELRGAHSWACAAVEGAVPQVPSLVPQRPPQHQVSQRVGCAGCPQGVEWGCREVGGWWKVSWGALTPSKPSLCPPQGLGSVQHLREVGPRRPGCG